MTLDDGIAAILPGPFDRGSIVSCTATVSDGYDVVDVDPVEARVSDTALPPDFNGDGITDAVIGVPGLHGTAGQVSVVWGSSGGLSAMSPTQLSQARGGHGVTSRESGDHYGTTTAWGDFDGDGFDDLVVAAPYEDWGTSSQTGVVTVVYGDEDGFALSRTELWGVRSGAVEQLVVFVSGLDERASLGASLAVGDFDGDGLDDLAVGSPDAEVRGVSGAGRVHVIYGSTQGLMASSAQDLDEDSFFGISSIGVDHAFGGSLAA